MIMYIHLLQTGTKPNNRTSGFYNSSQLLLTKTLKSVLNGKAELAEL